MIIFRHCLFDNYKNLTDKNVIFISLYILTKRIMANETKCIVFCGWQGSGKDTFSDYLVENKNWVKYSFAGKLKDFCAEEYDVDRVLFDDRKLKETKITDVKSRAFGKSPRDLCIIVGKKHRDINPDFWIEFVFNCIDKLSGKSNVVISDCRYPRELELLRETYQCLVIWINRWKEPPSKDKSELSLGHKDCDVTLDNIGLLEFNQLNCIINKHI